MNSFKYLTAPHCAKAVDFCKNLSHALHFCAETAKKRIVPRADLPVILCAVYSSIQFQHVKKEQTYPVCLLKIVAGYIIHVKPFSSFFLVEIISFVLDLRLRNDAQKAIVRH